jgi:hypothetical protein
MFKQLQIKIFAYDSNINQRLKSDSKGNINLNILHIYTLTQVI